MRQFRFIFLFKLLRLKYLWVVWKKHYVCFSTDNGILWWKWVAACLAMAVDIDPCPRDLCTERLTRLRQIDYRNALAHCAHIAQCSLPHSHVSPNYHFIEIKEKLRKSQNKIRSSKDSVRFAV